MSEERGKFTEGQIRKDFLIEKEIEGKREPLIGKGDPQRKKKFL